MPSHRTALLALMLALPAAALAQDETASQDTRPAVTEEAAETAAPGTSAVAGSAADAAAAINEAIAEISEALDPTLSPGEPADVREVDVVVRPGIVAQPVYEPGAPTMTVALTLDYAHSTDFDIPFPRDGFLLSPMARGLLDELGVALATPELADDRYLIAGHVEPTDDEGFDHWLSERRAAEARAYLVEAHAIDPSRLLTAGFGGEMPRENAAGAGADDTRIEVVLVEAVGEPRPVVVEEVGTQPVATGNVVCDSQPVALVDPRPGRHNLDDFGSPRTPVECAPVHTTRD